MLRRAPPRSLHPKLTFYVKSKKDYSDFFDILLTTLDVFGSKHWGRQEASFALCFIQEPFFLNF